MLKRALYQGETLRVERLPGGFAELCFDRQGSSVNKLDRKTVAELNQAITTLEGAPGLRGILICSAKPGFIVGADIREFGATFALPHAQLLHYLARSNDVLTRFESLDLPSVAAINGFALCGGLEFTLVAGYRVMAEEAQVGLPEVGLGLLPGFGGTVRLPRIVGLAKAIEWIALGKPHAAAAALADGVADKVCAAHALRNEAICLLDAVAASGKWRERRQAKRACIALPDAEVHVVVEAALERHKGGMSPRQPAGPAGIALLGRAAGMDGAQALLAEAQTFAILAKSQAAVSLVQIFVNEQVVRKLARGHARDAAPVRRMAVGAALGDTIATASAASGIAVSSRFDDSALDEVDLVIEAVAGDIHLKRRLLGEVEAAVGVGTVLATSSACSCAANIAAALARPQNLVGMFFFNPFACIPLVEIVAGPRTSAAAVARASAYVARLGKTPLLVKDCPGQLVNRVFAAYLCTFLELVMEGADFEKVDHAMEALGWLQGLAQMADAIGLDQAWHMNRAVSSGYRQRMPNEGQHLLRMMVDYGRLGEKNAHSFYRYQADTESQPRRSSDPQVHALLAGLQGHGPQAFDAQEIADRLMLPLVIAAASALEEAVVATPAEVDMAMLQGLGFPRHLGGPLKYADWHGLKRIAALSDSFAHLGQGWQLTLAMRNMARDGTGFYQRG